MSRHVGEEPELEYQAISRQWMRNSAISLFASKILASVGVLVAGMLLLRYLEPADYGYYQVIVSIATFTSLVFSFGFSPLVTRIIPELVELGNSRTAAKFLLSTLAIRAGVTAILLPVGFFAFGSIRRLFGLEELGDYDPLIVSALVIGVYLGTQTGPVILGAYARQIEMGVASVISAVLRVVLAVLIVSLDWGLIGVLIAIASLELAMMLGYLIRSAVAVRSQTTRTNRSESEQLTKRSIRYAAPHWVMTGLSFFEGRYGMIFVISGSLGTAAAGNYAFVFTVLQFGSVMNPVYTLNSLINNVIVRTAVHADQRTLLARGQRLFLTVSVYTSVPVAVYLLLLRAPLSQVFGFEQAGTGWLFLWAGIFFISNSAKLAYGNIFTQLEVPYYKLLFGGIGLIGIVVAIAVVNEYGIVGVAGAAAGASVVTLVIQHLVSRRILDIPVGVYSGVLLKILFINVLAGAATYTVVGVSDKFVIIALVTSAIFVVVYGASTLILKPFSAEDSKLIRSVIPKIPVPGFR